MKAGNVAYPPILDGELQGNLRACTVYIVGSDAALEDISFKLANFPLLQKEGLFGI
jgi:hypothetical protein